MGTLGLLSGVRLSLLRVSVAWAARRGCSAGGGGAAPAGDGGGGQKTYAVMGVYDTGSGYELSAEAKQMDEQCSGNLQKAIESAGGRLKLGQALVVPAPGGDSAAVALAGLGPQDPGYDSLENIDLTRENLRVGVGAAVRAMATGVARGGGVVLVDGGDAGEAADAAAEAATLAAWRFEQYKSCADRSGPLELRPSAGTDASAWEAGSVLGAAQNWARLLSDTPANKMTPVDLAQAALDVLCPLGCRVEAHDRDWITAQNMQAFLTVARGSCEPPVMLEVAWDGPGATSDLVLLAAKGVTFDSGGLCLKRPTSMVENRGSMAGAAVALAAIKVLAEKKVPIRVRLVAPLCENMISGQCMKVGDVVRALNGLSIQIEDTDMEGRLMMADALVYGQARYKPALVIDVATLTHGILLATGGGAFGCFCNAPELWSAVEQAGAATGDRPWRFPLWQYYHHKLVNDQSVDLRNKGSSKATPCLGAAFLRNFVCGDWLHMDITGVGKLAHAPAPPYLDPRRMTGRPARTLARLLTDLADNQKGKKK